MSFKQIISFIAPLGLIIAGITMQSIIQNEKVFVGYINEKPVFDSFSEKKLYVLNDKLEFLTSYPEGYTVLTVRNNCIGYSLKGSTIISCKGNETSYAIAAAYMSITDDGVAYVSDKKGAIKTLSSGKITDFGKKGYVVSIVNNYLYYSVEHNPEVDYANSDLYKINLNALKEITKIATDISGESTVISPTGAYVFDNILYKGKFVPAIFSTVQNRYHILNIQPEYQNGIPYYSLKEDALVFYDSNNLATFKIQMPIEFTIQR